MVPTKQLTTVEVVEVIERALPHFQAILNCGRFIVTGSYALYKMGLVQEVHDLDIILINPSVDAEDTLFNLQMLPESKHLVIDREAEYGDDDLGLVRIMYEGVKIDFFKRDIFTERQTMVLANGIEMSTASYIFQAKKCANRFKDWLSLRSIAAKIFNEVEFNKFLDGTNKKG